MEGKMEVYRWREKNKSANIYRDGVFFIWSSYLLKKIRCQEGQLRKRAMNMNFRKADPYI